MTVESIDIRQGKIIDLFDGNCPKCGSNLILKNTSLTKCPFIKCIKCDYKHQIYDLNQSDIDYAISIFDDIPF